MEDLPKIFLDHPALVMLHKGAQNSIEASTAKFWQNFLPYHFSPTDNYLYHWESPADNSLRRVDGLIEKYDGGHDTALPVLFIEFKRDHGDIKEVENQAKNAMKLKIEDLGLTGLYALTTLGTNFRFWQMGKCDEEMTPLDGFQAVGVRWAYLEICSQDGTAAFDKNIDFVKTERPMMIAPTLKSQRDPTQQTS